MAQGHRQALAAPPDAPLAARARALGVPVVAWSPRHDLDVSAARALARAARAFAPDVLHLHSARAHAAGLLAARVTGAATLVARRVDFDVARHPLSALKYRLPVDRYVAVSRAIADVLVRCGVPETRIAVVHSGIDVPRVAASVATARAEGRGALLRREWGVPEGAHLVGIVAALAPHKDHGTFVAAAARVAALRPDAHFVVAGDGPGAEAVRADVEASGLTGRVARPGFVKDVAAVFAALDVFVLSSYLEGLGTSVLDAMAAGVPVVATQVGGIPEMITQEEHGLLVPPRDPGALAEAVTRVLTDPAAATERARRSRERVDAFSLAGTVDATGALYRRVLAERKARV